MKTKKNPAFSLQAGFFKCKSTEYFAIYDDYCDHHCMINVDFNINFYPWFADIYDESFCVLQEVVYEDKDF